MQSNHRHVLEAHQGGVPGSRARAHELRLGLRCSSDDRRSSKGHFEVVVPSGRFAQAGFPNVATVSHRPVLLAEARGISVFSNTNPSAACCAADFAAKFGSRQDKFAARCSSLNVSSPLYCPCQPLLQSINPSRKGREGPRMVNPDGPVKWVHHPLSRERKRTRGRACPGGEALTRCFASAA